MIDTKKLKLKIVKEKICDTLENRDRSDNGKCVLLIFPFIGKKYADIFVKDHFLDIFARNLLEVDDNFYDEILERYKLFNEDLK